MKDKDKQSIVQIAVGEYGYKSSKYVERVCPECGESYRRYKDEIEYECDGLLFCTFPCKNKYRKRLNPDNLSSSEIIVNKYNETLEKQRKRQRANYTKNKALFYILNILLIII